MPKKNEIIEEATVQEAPQKVAQTEAAPVAEPVQEKSPVETEFKEPKKAPKGKKDAAPVVEPQEVAPKKVRVMLVQDVDCLINGVRYEYPAQKMIEIPEDAAQILVFGKKAYRM